MLNIKEKLKHHFHEVAKSKTSAHAIALGFAIGTAIGLFPTPGFGTLLGVIIALILEKVNKVSIFIAMAIWNPIVCAPFTILSYELGDIILGSRKLITFSSSFLNRFSNLSIKYFLGNIIITVTASVLMYFLVKYAVIIYRKRKHNAGRRI
jgi:uncharacterized protein (DUF2062 family)